MIVGGALLGVAAYRVQVNDILSPADRAAAQIGRRQDVVDLHPVSTPRNAPPTITNSHRT